MPKFAEPEIASQPTPALGETPDDWLCAWCHNPVAKEKDRFFNDGKSEFTFANPEGTRFEIITFSQTIGCLQEGIPTTAHTWFPGQAWSYCLCDGCGFHLGWYYTGQQEFIGLIKSRITRAAHMGN
jgi:hypothetical protein